MEMEIDRQNLLEQSTAEPKFLISIKKSLDRLNSFPREQMHFGPTYKINSRLGELSVNVIFSPTNEWQTEYYILAKDKDGKIVGKRTGSIFDEDKKLDDKHKRALFIKGKIEVERKGAGLAIPIELVFIDVLQSLANAEKRPVVWEIENENLQKLEEARAEIAQKIISGTVTNEDQTNLKNLEEEQLRWQALYGPNGKIGMDIRPVGFDKKKFLPKDSEIDFDQTQEIKLERIDNDDGTVTPQMVSATPAQENFQAECLQKLEADIQKYS